MRGLVGWVETSSSIKTFLTCQTKYLFSYVRLRRPIAVARPLLVGGAFHGVAEAYWRGELDGLGQGPARALMNARGVLAGRGDAEGLDAYDRQLAARLGLQYVATWSLAPAGRPVAVEHAFALPARDLTPLAPRDVTLAGKIDLLTRDDHDYLTLVEHKTAGGEKPGYFERLRLDTQLAVYDEVTRRIVAEGGHAGYAGILYDVATKPAIKPYQRTANLKFKANGEPYANQRTADETADEFGKRVTETISTDRASYFRRYHLARPQAASEDGKRHLAQALRQIGHARLYGPTRNPGACFDHGSPCAYFDVCTNAVGLDDNARFRDAIAHEELAAPSGAGVP